MFTLTYFRIFDIKYVSITIVNRHKLMNLFKLKFAFMFERTSQKIRFKLHEFDQYFQFQFRNNVKN